MPGGVGGVDASSAEHAGTAQDWSGSCDPADAAAGAVEDNGDGPTAEAEFLTDVRVRRGPQTAGGSQTRRDNRNSVRSGKTFTSASLTENRPRKKPLTRSVPVCATGVVGVGEGLGIACVRFACGGCVGAATRSCGSSFADQERRFRPEYRHTDDAGRRLLGEGHDDFRLWFVGERDLLRQLCRERKLVRRRETPRTGRPWAAPGKSFFASAARCSIAVR